VKRIKAWTTQASSITGFPEDTERVIILESAFQGTYIMVIEDLDYQLSVRYITNVESIQHMLNEGA